MYDKFKRGTVLLHRTNFFGSCGSWLRCVSGTVASLLECISIGLDRAQKLLRNNQQRRLNLESLVVPDRGHNIESRPNPLGRCMQN